MQKYHDEPKQYKGYLKSALAEITAQVTQLKDAAAEQAKAAAAEALQSELDRVRRSTVVQERVIRLAPPPMEPSVTPSVAEADAPIADNPPTPDTTDGSPETSQKDYYSLWHAADGTDAESDEPAALASRTSNPRRMVFGGVAAACILVGVLLSSGGNEETGTGSILIDGPPAAQVWLEGTLIGETPLPEISAELGEREVVVIHPENGEVRQTVTVGADATAVVSLDQ